MNFAGKAYVKKKPGVEANKEEKLSGPLKEIEEQALEESLRRSVVEPLPKRIIKRQKSIERLSISSLNHSLNSNSMRSQANGADQCRA